MYLFIFGCAGSSVTTCRLSLVAVSKGCSLLRHTGFSLRWLLLLRSTGSKLTNELQLWLTGSVVWHTGFICSGPCGIFLDQGLNPCPLRWQADSYPLYHQGSPPFQCNWWGCKLPEYPQDCLPALFPFLWPACSHVCCPDSVPVD